MSSMPFSMPRLRNSALVKASAARPALSARFSSAETWGADLSVDSEA